MPLQVQPMQEADFPDLYRIQVAAFSGPGMTALLTPNPVPEGFTQKSIDKHVKSWREEPDVCYLKVVDSELGGKMVAAAKWRINKTERTEGQIQSMLPVPGKDEEGRLGLQDFMWYLNRVRREYMGTKPFYFLHMLVTDPEHHRRGAGELLVRWGTEQADEAQLPSFLEASLMGRPLYARLGFEPQEEEVWDLKKYGLEGTDVSTPMIRQPVEAK